MILFSICWAFILVLALFVLTRGPSLLSFGRNDSLVSKLLNLFVQRPLIGFATHSGNHRQLQPVPRFRDYIVYIDKFRRR